ncbi:hypothetical protein MHL30_21290 [Priestia flexa]|uniref:hypothetical protein n=1 Tax=Priestia flexa TaxID=86664 RepID=UPI001EF3E7FB|nr:hypothetical protein [Priestia flexa]MCG7315614.1 hypothetical protein [Priestia flexa]
MAHPFEESEVKRWLVSGAGTDSLIKSQVMKKVTNFISEQRNLDVQIVNTIDSETIVIRATLDTVKALQITFGDSIIIASDTEVHLFSPFEI